MHWRYTLAIYGARIMYESGVSFLGRGLVRVVPLSYLNGWVCGGGVRARASGLRHHRISRRTTNLKGALLDVEGLLLPGCSCICMAFITYRVLRGRNEPMGPGVLTES